jgi:anaerobic C4-dicarboxylate transporter DcuA
VLGVEVAVVVVVIVVGARLGGIGLGAAGGLGVVILTFGCRLPPAAPPIDVILMIAAVVTAAGALQAAGGFDHLVRVAERILRRNPGLITYLGPTLTYLFTLFAGTGQVAYALLPVIAEIARETGVRPERPISVSVIASQLAITASPVSAATVALLGVIGSTPGSGLHISLLDILRVCVPSTFIGCALAAVVANRVGHELESDPEYRSRLSAERGASTEERAGRGRALRAPSPPAPAGARRAVAIFTAAAVCIVLVSAVPALRMWGPDGRTVLDIPQAFEMVMLTATALILLVCRVPVDDVARSSVFVAGMQAVVAIFGIAWMGETFVRGNAIILGTFIQAIVTRAPWSFALALFALSVLLYSQAGTVRTLMPLGVTVGISPLALVAMFPAVNGFFVIPNYPTIVAAIEFDRTGTTKIGRYILNHSFMLPGLIATIGSVAVGFLLVRFG